jgi:AcrR family transcriptional regulator
VEEVVHAAGYSKGTFYYYVDSKADLLYRIHDRFISREIEDAEAILAAGGTAEERLRRLVHSLVRSIHDYLPLVTVFFDEVRHLEGPHLDRIRAKRDYYESIYVRIFEEGARAGEFRADVEPRIEALAVFGMCNWLYRWYRPAGQLGPEAIADRFLGIVLDGVRA